MKVAVNWEVIRRNFHKMKETYLKTSEDSFIWLLTGHITFYKCILLTYF